MTFTQFKVHGKILSMEINAEIKDSRFRTICEELDRAKSVLKKFRLVMVIRHYPSFNSAEDLYFDLRFLRLYDHHIEKVAVISDRSWKDTWVGIFSLFSGINMAFFDMSQAAAASSWIQE